MASGHMPHQVRCFVAGHPGRGDKQWTHRGSAEHRLGMGSRAEGSLGHADHRDAELSVRMRTQAGPAAGVKVSVAIDHQEAQSAQTVQDRTDRRESRR